MATHQQSMRIHFQKALLPGGWSDNVMVISDGWRIVDVQSDVANVPYEAIKVAGAAVPGMTNVHSHAFQRAFAGLSEYRTGQHDSFWTWRRLMYEFLEKLQPEDVYEIGKQLYSEMMLAGYTTVGEFHYLLHQTDGTPYENVNEMADALIRAAIDTGIRICMLPVYYQRGGFDDSPLQGGQKRFGSNHDLFLKMADKLNSDWGDHPQVRLGVALHSLRAVSIPAGQALLSDIESILPGCPIHVHVAEQTAEVDDCLAAHGKRPVQLLMDSYDVNQRWCLIHATHMDDQELALVANSGAVVGVCPTTEANLGDGIFRSEDFLLQQGRLAIGSDSHISVDACEELRLLEYAQRLSSRRRAVLCTDQESCGSLLYRWATDGGAQVTGFGPAAIEPELSCQIGIIDHSGLGTIGVDRYLDYCVFQSSAAKRLHTSLNLRQ